MKNYIMCLDKEYKIELGERDNIVIDNLETMLDNMINLLQSYGIGEDEILHEIEDNTTIKIMEVE